MSHNNEQSKPESVRPHWGERGRMALWCRKELSPTQRLVLAALADLCIHDRPTEVIKLSVQSFAVITGFDRKAVGKAMQVLVDKGLVKRRLDGRNAWRKKRKTSINWALIRENQLDWSALSDDDEGEDIEVFPNIEYDEPSPKNVKPSEPQVRASVMNEEPSIPKHEEPKMPKVSAPKQKPSAKAAPRPHVMEWVPLTDSGLEPIGELFVRLMEERDGTPHTFYSVSDQRRVDAIEKLQEFDEDEQLRSALDLCLCRKQSKWNDELRNKSRIPHARLAKVRDLVVEEYLQVKKEWKKEEEESGIPRWTDRQFSEIEVECICERYGLEFDRTLSDADFLAFRDDLVVLMYLSDLCGVEDFTELQNELVEPTGKLRVDEIPYALKMALRTDRRGRRRGRKWFQLAQSYPARWSAVSAAAETPELLSARVG